MPLSDAQLAALTKQTTTRPFEPAEAATAAGATALDAGQLVYTDESAGQGWELCFVQGRGWIFVPASCLPPKPPPPPDTKPQLPPLSSAGEDERYKVCLGTIQPPLTGLPASPLPRRGSPARHRLQVALELAHTEKSYGTAVRLVAQTLVKPLRDTEILSEMEIAKMFSSVEQARAKGG